jgi:DUF4097 and DUF4098 domain-containing protein YvlB
MHGLILATALALGASRMDTTLAVSHGARLELENYAGDIDVQTWDRNAVRIEADRSRHTDVDIDSEDDAISISVSNERGAPTSVDFRLTVPAWMSVKLSGVYCDITSTGLKGPFEAGTVQGDIEVKGGSGRVEAQSVQGSVTVQDASGEIEVSSVNEAVNVRSVRGRLTAESVNGAVVVRQSELESLEASTVNGTVVYDGSFARGGHYELSTHNGSVYVAIPEKADLSVEVSTYSGSFDSTFPIKRSNEDRHSHRFEFTLGEGAADLSLESFQGSIVLHRPGEHVEGEDQAVEIKSRHEDQKQLERQQKRQERKLDKQDRREEQRSKEKDKSQDQDDDSDGGD